MGVRSFAAVLAAASVLAACGGGGDGAPAGVTIPTDTRSVSASTGADITAANYSTLAGPLARAVVNGSSTESPLAAGNPQSALAIGALARRAALGVVPGRESALAVHNSSMACPAGGSITTSYNDADNSQTLSGGDTFSMSLTNCVYTAGDAPLSGTLVSMTVHAVELNAQQEATAMDMSLTLYAIDDPTFGGMSGTYRIWFREEGTSTQMRVRYEMTQALDDDATVYYDFDIYGTFTDTSGSFTINGGLRVNGQTYSLVSGLSFSYSANANPSAGYVTLSDAAGDRLVLRARTSTTVDLEFYAAGATTPTATQTNVAWSSLL
jgi:hypothetical protein